jgi:hypothetical protein
MATNDTPNIGLSTGKLYLISGAFSSTIKTSEAALSGNGIDWDGVNTPWTNGSRLILQSGQFTSTIKDSELISGIDVASSGISADGVNTPWCGAADDKMYLQSGQFTSTLKTSESSPSSGPNGISADGVNTPLCDSDTDRLYLVSGQFSSTVKSSVSIGAKDNNPTGISWNGTDTPWCGRGGDKLYMQSGQVTSTMKTSQSTVSWDANPEGISTNNYEGRIPDLGITGDVAIELPVIIVSGVSTFHNDVVIILPAVAINGVSNWHGDASINLPVFTIMGLTVGANLNGDVALDLPMFTLDSVALLETDIAVTLPIIILSARTYNGSAPECVVMNTKNFAVTEYINYGFNSMTEFNGEHLVADQNGIYKVDTSDTDNAGIDNYVIKAHIKTGRVDIYKDNKNVIRNGWLNYQTDGSVQIVSTADKKATRTYMLPYHLGLSGINERRVKFERGIKNRFFDFKVQNVMGSQLEIDKLTITLEPVISKRR